MPQHDDPTMLMPDDDRPQDFFIEVEVIGQIDRYHLIRLLGSGAFGAVYLAHDSVAEIQVALKAVPRVVVRHSEALERTRRNFSLVTCLSHPNITTIRHLHEAVNVDEDAREFMGIHPGDYVIVMDVAAGVTLNKLRREAPNGRLSPERALRICRQVADALDYAHGQNIIHRDIKPGNIIVSDDGHVEVLDFGLAANIEESVAKYSRELQKICGTRQYMAPEQWAGTQQGPATDQYALGVVFYELVSGAVPFADAFKLETREEIMEQVMTRSVSSLKTLNRRQNRALQRALAKHPEDRFRSCRALVDELSGVPTTNSSMAPMLLLAGLILAVGVVAAMILQPQWFLDPGNHDSQVMLPPSGPAVYRVPDDVIALQSQATVLHRQLEKLNPRDGFEAKVTSFLAELEKSNGYLRNHEAAAARDLLQKVLVQGEDLLKLSDARDAAARARHQAQQARQQARKVEAENLAPGDWEEAVRVSKRADDAFAAGDFAGAREVFEHAAKAFAAATRTTNHRARAEQARTAWQEVLAAADQEVLQAFGDKAWENLSFAVRVAERQLQEGEYARAEEAFQKAAKELPDVASAALQAQADSIRLQELDEQLARAQDLMKLARDSRADLSRRKEVLKLYEQVSAILGRLLKLKYLPKERWAVAAAIQDEVQTAVAVIDNGPKELFAWRVDLGKDLELGLAHIPPGDFMLGSGSEERGWVEKRTGKIPVNEGEDPRQVTVKLGFWMARTEITVEQFRVFADAAKYRTQAETEGWAWVWNAAEEKWDKGAKANWREPGYPPQPGMPVTCCTWNDAVAFCRWLTKRDHDAGRLPADLEYRLPTEAEWEYACRAGQKGRPRFWWGDDWADAKGRANVRDATPLDVDRKRFWPNAAEWEDGWSLAAPVDQFGKLGRNPFGLADMLGNVAEWVLDSYDETQAAADYGTPVSAKRVIRGGSFHDGPARLRNAARAAADPDTARQDIGFRIVCARIIPLLD